jgi:hypothetical protein
MVVSALSAEFKPELIFFISKLEDYMEKNIISFIIKLLKVINKDETA